MEGIYIHIPFCASRCIYCGFYSTTQAGSRQRYVNAVCREIVLRKDECHEAVETVYIGGGTPSQLSDEQLRQLFLYINKVYGPLNSKHEVTVECNPDDVTSRLADTLKQVGVNRVSMGVQTFSNERLAFLRRRHTAEQIQPAVEHLRRAGIDNISIDLMYGFPGETIDDWHHDIDAALALHVQHLSAYSLMYEEGTPLYRMLEQGRVSEVDEELSLQMFGDLADRLHEAGYEHYEISNFALPGFRSRHNSSYWHGTPYTGLGAAAHSYDGGNRRQWNVSDIEKYMAGIEHGLPQLEFEELSPTDRYNERVMTALRTCEGLPLSELTPTQRSYCLHQAEPFLADGQLVLSNNTLRLSRRGIFVSNMVMATLFL